uniref:Uncharacterized protein n=1 Tax=Nelumbo nucifera TaxID=4432 RepID=A0A822YEY4_NELNU|nr:TPA_asm: hypothetical protein HUJ06_029546 [Nelumbo nucifera]
MHGSTRHALPQVDRSSSISINRGTHSHSIFKCNIRMMIIRCMDDKNKKNNDGGSGDEDDDGQA